MVVGVKAQMIALDKHDPCGIRGFLYQCVTVLVGAGGSIMATQGFKRGFQLVADTPKRGGCFLRRLIGKRIQRVAAG